MAELKTRIECEDDFKKQLNELSDDERAELILLLGYPPDPRNVPESFWQEMRRARRAVIFHILYETFLNAARIHGMSREDAAARARRFATARAAQVANGFVKHTREMLVRAWRKWNAKIAEIRRNGAKHELLPRAVEKEIHDYLDGTLESDFEAIIGETRDARIAQHEFSVAQAGGAEEGAQEFEFAMAITLERWWRHSDVRPPGHSNAPNLPCDICSDLEGTQAPWAHPGELGPGLVHVGCDCFTEYVITILGIIWGGEDCATWDWPSRDPVRGSGSFA